MIDGVGDEPLDRDPPLPPFPMTPPLFLRAGIAVAPSLAGAARFLVRGCRISEQLVIIITSTDSPLLNHIRLQ